jgi:hypothetical protein
MDPPKSIDPSTPIIDFPKVLRQPGDNGIKGRTFHLKA